MIKKRLKKKKEGRLTKLPQPPCPSSHTPEHFEADVIISTLQMWGPRHRWAPRTGGEGLTPVVVIPHPPLFTTPHTAADQLFTGSGRPSCLHTDSPLESTFLSLVSKMNQRF